MSKMNQVNSGKDQATLRSLSAWSLPQYRPAAFIFGPSGFNSTCSLDTQHCSVAASDTDADDVKNVCRHFGCCPSKWCIRPIKRWLSQWTLNTDKLCTDFSGLHARHR